MYSTKSGLVLGFHGCDQSTLEKVLTQNSPLKRSTNKYDWLGNGVYFWENSPERALDFAKSLKENPRKGKKPISTPCVLGAVLDLGHCLDFMSLKYLNILTNSYDTLAQVYEQSGLKIPENISTEENGDLLLRRLDCAVIELIIKTKKKPKFDSVRAVFWEGDVPYPNAGFKKKNHIQICIRNPNCIKGYFRPLELLKSYKRV